MAGVVPEWLLTACIAVTVFTVMFGIGLGVAPRELGRLWRSPAPMVPGAPVALRSSLAAGAHAAFAPGLQISVAILAVVSMPLSIAAPSPARRATPGSRCSWRR